MTRNQRFFCTLDRLLERPEKWTMHCFYLIVAPKITCGHQPVSLIAGRHWASLRGDGGLQTSEHHKCRLLPGSRQLRHVAESSAAAAGGGMQIVLSCVWLQPELAATSRRRRTTTSCLESVRCAHLQECQVTPCRFGGGAWPERKSRLSNLERIVATQARDVGCKHAALGGLRGQFRRDGWLSSAG